MARKVIDIIGNIYGKLKVEKLHNIINKKTFWECKCICGNVIILKKSNLISGNTKSCGCSSKNNAITHNMSNTIFYNKFSKIKERCNNPNSIAYKNYGGRGIKCEWDTFEEFYNDMYESYLKHCEEYGEKETTIDRIDVNGNYCKENCRWATIKEQANNRSNNHYIIYNGESKTIMQWCEYFNINYSKTLQRINILGWPIDKNLFFKK